MADNSKVALVNVQYYYFIFATPTTFTTTATVAITDVITDIASIIN